MFATNNPTVAYRTTGKITLELPTYLSTDTLPDFPVVDNGSMVWVQDVSTGALTLKVLQNGKWGTVGG